MPVQLDDLTGYVLRRASHAANAEFAALLVPLNLRVAEAGLLLLIAERPGIAQAEAGRILDIQRANMTPLCARLERARLIARAPIDGRTQSLKLGDEGKALLPRLRGAVAAHKQLLQRRMPAELRAQVLPVLRALWGRAE